MTEEEEQQQRKPLLSLEKALAILDMSDIVEELEKRKEKRREIFYSLSPAATIAAFSAYQAQHKGRHILLKKHA